MKYFGQPEFQHGEVPAVGVLVANLGTPDAPDTPALRRYLREFLLDPRVIELPRVLWWLILHLFILTTRPAKSAALYRKVWTPEGSPLLAISKRQAAALQAVLSREVGTPVHVAVAMRYGNPSVSAALRELWEREGEPEKLLFSFHGIPKRYFLAGDPYFCECQKLARLAAEELRLPRERWQVSFQSLFGREEWLRPYTNQTITALAEAGVRNLDIICPGFSADCLETIEEIDQENREVFRHAGGERYRYIPALNDRPDHIRVLADLVHRNLQGWVRSPAEWNDEEARRAAADSRRRAEEKQSELMTAGAGAGPRP